MKKMKGPSRLSWFCLRQQIIKYQNLLESKSQTQHAIFIKTSSGAEYINDKIHLLARVSANVSYLILSLCSL